MGRHGIFLLLDYSGPLLALVFESIVDPQQPKNQYKQGHDHEYQKHHQYLKSMLNQKGFPFRSLYLTALLHLLLVDWRFGFLRYWGLLLRTLLWRDGSLYLRLGLVTEISQLATLIALDKLGRSSGIASSILFALVLLPLLYLHPAQSSYLGLHNQVDVAEFPIAGVLAGVLAEQPQRVVAQGVSQKVDAAGSQRHQSLLAGKAHLWISVPVIGQGVHVLGHHFGVEVLPDGHEEDVLAAGDFVHQCPHLLDLLDLQVVETQVVFGEEGGACLCDGEELSIAMPLVVKLGQFTEHVPGGPDFIADQPVGEGLVGLPVVHVGGVEGGAVHDDVVIQRVEQVGTSLPGCSKPVVERVVLGVVEVDGHPPVELPIHEAH